MTVYHSWNTNKRIPFYQWSYWHCFMPSTTSTTTGPSPSITCCLVWHWLWFVYDLSSCGMTTPVEKPWNMTQICGRHTTFWRPFSGCDQCQAEQKKNWSGRTSYTQIQVSLGNNWCFLFWVTSFLFCYVCAEHSLKKQNCQSHPDICWIHPLFLITSNTWSQKAEWQSP